MIDSRDIADIYLATWNEGDAGLRRTLIAARWAADARYVDPVMSGTGADGIAAMIESARAQFPGHCFALRGTPDSHNRHVRFSWSLVSGEGRPVAGGTDIVRLDDAGRIAEVTGFLDTLPA
ncbi:nuclear transport factor 2 family protein [Chelatococcus asaccharovorans]|uniref:SnoaL-like protein n=1 Tax=Chelatococcus asaccharovorans TaxID=28210 RepID=A0A2V3UKJ0_9HYPH|nr:nuclear transport factor 2 family protein [Chelatococcus asaccharovorans]MBS7705568.1 nuclear transport factor 2 family protein [Chelatococcus asaccharovorans]PXW60022.1 SnoaL-like protein [Chelatococcus asaccharovorans]CAH1656433.1 SnoaL-like protein [Chelatococcus asaccharovorans]CAH1685113.1 SnoaL-like protein [Chelatococcus asaccharovorans]